MDYPALVSCFFSRGETDFARLASALAFTAERHCPHWDRTVAPLSPARAMRGVAAPYVDNTHKLAHWAGVVAAAPLGSRLCLIDADTVILRPLDPVWDWEFELAYTTKVQPPFPFNLGVVFVRVSAAVRAFFHTWQRENAELASHPEIHAVWRQKYGGINQAAFGRLLESGRLETIRSRTLPCAEWNCEESGWPTFDPAVTRILHLKGVLRRCVLGVQVVPRPLQPLTSLWREIDRAATRMARTA